jgi:hypothetical protein
MSHAWIASPNQDKYHGDGGDEQRAAHGVTFAIGRLGGIEEDGYSAMASSAPQ